MALDDGKRPEIRCDFLDGANFCICLEAVSASGITNPKRKRGRRRGIRLRASSIGSSLPAQATTRAANETRQLPFRRRYDANRACLPVPPDRRTAASPWRQSVTLSLPALSRTRRRRVDLHREVSGRHLPGIIARDDIGLARAGAPCFSRSSLIRQPGSFDASRRIRDGPAAFGPRFLSRGVPAEATPASGCCGSGIG